MRTLEDSSSEEQAGGTNTTIKSGYVQDQHMYVLQKAIVYGYT